MYSFIEIAAFFMFYAMFGWCTEVIYAASTSGKFVNRGFLNGPVCPIYGVGAVIVILCLTPFQDNLLFLFAASVILTSALEFATGFILEKVFHQKWWDYTEDPFNIMGYICLKFSLLWGVACILIMKVVQPVLIKGIAKIQDNVMIVVLCIVYGLLLIDMIVTAVYLSKLHLQIRLISDINKFLNKISETVGSRLSDGTLKGITEFNEQRGKIDNRYDHLIKKAKKKYGELYRQRAERQSYIQKRLDKAFPKLCLSNINEISEKFDKLKKDIEAHKQALKKKD